MGLKEQIERWPEAMKAARLRVAEAEVAYAKVELDLSQAQARQGMFDHDSEASWRAADRADVAQSAAKSAKHEEARQRQAQAEEDAWLARDAVNRAKAAADVQIRQEADVSGKRLTESAVRARVQVHPDVIAAEQRWREAQAQVAAARAETRTVWWEAPGPVSDPDDESDEEIMSEAEIALQSLIAEMHQRRVDILRQLELARAEVDYQRTVGKALGMLAKLAAAEIAAGR